MNRELFTVDEVRPGQTLTRPHHRDTTIAQASKNPTKNTSRCIKPVTNLFCNLCPLLLGLSGTEINYL